MERFKEEAILDAARDPNELCRFVISIEDDENNAFDSSFLFQITKNYKSTMELGDIIQQELEDLAKRLMHEEPVALHAVASVGQLC
jgi:hypothetical protein